MDGGQIRLKGEGQKGYSGGPAGDMMIRINVQPHRFFKRKGMDITCEVPLTLNQAVKGSRIRINTINGKKVELRVPPKTQDGTAFKLRGMGIENNKCKGDQYVTVRVKAPENPTKEEKELMAELTI
jgi:molecular chaperone DnaJ